MDDVRIPSPGTVDPERVRHQPVTSSSPPASGAPLHRTASLQVVDDADLDLPILGLVLPALWARISIAVVLLATREAHLTAVTAGSVGCAIYPEDGAMLNDLLVTVTIGELAAPHVPLLGDDMAGAKASARFAQRT